jgi:hypothetical protein
MQIFPDLGRRLRWTRPIHSRPADTVGQYRSLGRHPQFPEAAKHADALAVAPYMPFSIGRGKTKDLGEQMKNWNVDQLLDYFEETAFQNSLGRMDKDKAVADKYGLKLIAYEGGQHMVAFVKDRDLVARLTETMQQANRHPRMGDLYRRYFDHWADIGGGTFAVSNGVHASRTHAALPRRLDHAARHKPRPAWKEPGGSRSGSISTMPTPYRVGRHGLLRLFIGSCSSRAGSGDGPEKWVFFTDAPVRLAPEFHGGHVLFTSDDGYLYCLTQAMARWSGSIVRKVFPTNA